MRMKPQPTDPGNERWRELLQEWRPEGEVPPGFAAGVWSRLARRPAPAPWAAGLLTCWETFHSMANRPAFVGPCLAGIVILAGTAGWWESCQSGARRRGQMANQYWQSVHPDPVREAAP